MHSLGCDLWCVFSSLVLMTSCFVCCANLVISSKLRSQRMLSGLRMWDWGIHFVCEVCRGFEWHLKWMEHFVTPYFSLMNAILNACIYVMAVLSDLSMLGCVS